MFFTLNAVCGCGIGTGRSNNEDNFFFNKKHLPAQNKGLNNPMEYDATTENPVVFAVFDGMGGECQGEEAARLVSEVFSEEYKTLEELALSGKEFMLTTCEKANVAVNEYRREKQLSSIGTTAAAIYLAQNEVVACNVGDSKIFRIRDKKMTQISEDHTDEKILLKMGIQKKPVLLQYIGIPDTDMAMEPYVSKGEIQIGDTYVLCTDGVTDLIGVDRLYEMISRNPAEDAVRKITAEVNETSGTDNATIIVVKIA